MADNKNRIDNLHNQMPAVANTRVNTNWKALLEALGQSDQDTLDLIEAVGQQFFIKTASRPYLDRLGTASLVQRPRFVGMDDTSFRSFIPIMSYQPKQVKLVLDDLLDLFFFKDSTTSFIFSDATEPFVLEDGWELEYSVDTVFTERVLFKSDDFTNIAAATANEIVASINRQAIYSYAIAFEDSISKKTNIRIFTKTIGTKGSLEITGGRANIALKFDGFNFESGFGINTQWQVTKIGDTVSLQYTGLGGTPRIDQLNAGDVVILNKPTNVGSFVITDVNASTNTIKYINLFATPETFTQSAVNDVKFFTPIKSTVYLKDRRALVWEVRPGEIVVEMPASPPVVKRKRAGSAHINGLESLTANIISSSSMELVNATNWPTSGKIFFVPLNEIKTYYPLTADTTEFNYNSKLSSDLPVYTYASRVGNILSGISPALPDIASLNTFNLVTANRDASNIITVITSTAHNFNVNEYAIIRNAVQGVGTGPDTNGTWKITEVVSSTQFKCYSFGGAFGSRMSSGGTTLVEKPGMAETGARVILTTAQLQPNNLGPYIWDENADFVLSSLTADLTAQIKAGSTKRTIEVTTNNMPNEAGRVIFDFGTEKQEGPIRYFSKPNSTALALDPSYVFNFTHDIGSSVTMIRRRGGIKFSGLGTEFAPYVTDPAAARIVLQDLMQQVKSVGIFINFLIRYPVNYYSTVDLYKSNVDPG